MIHDDQMIGALVAEHLAIIQEEDITMDAKLLEAALLLHAKKVDGVAIGETQMFMVYRECKSHRVCKKQKNNATLCTKCSNKGGVKKWQEERRQKHYKERTLIVFV